MALQSRSPWRGTLAKPIDYDDRQPGRRWRRIRNYQGQCGDCGHREWTNEVHKGPAADLLRNHGWLCPSCHEQYKRRRQEERAEERQSQREGGGAA